MKKHKIIFWVTTILLFLFEGVMPVFSLIFAPASATAGVVYLGYPVYFAYILIAFKALGSIALVIPRLPRRYKEWAYAGLGFDFICASISHFVVDGAGFVSFFPLIFLAVLALSYHHYFKLYPNGKN
jgi:hypothetical protein